MNSTVPDSTEIAPVAPAKVSVSVLSGLPLAMVLTNPHMKDNPIVYVNEAFTNLTGHPAASVIGRNCRLLQGEKTEPDQLERIRQAVDAGEDISLELTNYRADCSTFLNRLSITPLVQDEEVEYFLGTMSTASDTDQKFEAIQTQLLEIQHRIKNHLAMVVSLIRIQARSNAPDLDYTVLARRVEALQLLYSELSETGVSSTGSAEVPLGAYVSRIAAAVGHLDGRPGVRVNVTAEEVMVDPGTAGRVGLLVSEILTNAFRHAFDERDTGLVETRLQRLSDGVIRIQVSDDGIGLPEELAWPTAGNLGSRIAQSLLEGLNARHSIDTSTAGTTITIDIPAPDAPTEQGD